MEENKRLSEPIPADIRQDIKIVGTSIKEFVLIIIPMFILGCFLFVQLPGSYTIRFLIFILCIVMGFYIVIGDVFYRSRVKRRMKQIRQTLDAENIQNVEEFQGSFIVYQDGTVGVCIEVDTSPWQYSPINNKAFDVQVFKRILRLCAGRKYEIITMEENKADNSSLDIRYRELFSPADPLYQLAESRKYHHSRIKDLYGRKTYYIWRIRQLYPKRNVKESVKEVVSLVHEIRDELARIGATAILLGEDEIAERSRSSLLPEGEVYKPLYMEANFFKKVKGELLSWGKLMGLLVSRGRKGLEESQQSSLNEEEDHLPQIDPIDPRELNRRFRFKD